MQVVRNIDILEGELQVGVYMGRCLSVLESFQSVA